MSKRKKQRKTPQITASLAALLILAVIWLVGGTDSSLKSFAAQPLQTVNQLLQQSPKQQQSPQQPAEKLQQSDLAQLTYVSGKSAVVEVNGGKSMLKPSDWQTNQVEYHNLDSLNRTSGANVAYLEPRNLANDSLRVRQYVQPTGWHQKFLNREPIVNRGHLIAYSLSKGIAQNGSYDPSLPSGDQNNPKNLFTQTAFANQKLQTIYEARVREALRSGQKVIYAAQAIFRSNELMARGVHLQAISLDGSLNFNVYIYNVQPGVEFDYATGRSTINRQLQVPEPTR
ncbi:DNA/RNA non-specific endonuclease [Liquorilactobacillus ghanensis]|uniref:DNA/RNA non-specific endonuclease n=1 Tax=Liquorilactobacillus ghanensis TaxID=399370 RepID=UPI0039E90D0F